MSQGKAHAKKILLCLTINSCFTVFVFTIAYMQVYLCSEMETQNLIDVCACVCTIDGLVDDPVTHCRRLRWIPDDPEAVVPLL